MPPESDGPPIDISAPVEAEVYVVFHDDGRLWLTGPCGAAPWRVESHARHPIDLVRAMAAASLGPPTLVHSTSWRWDHEAVVLSFLVVVEPAHALGLEIREIVRADLARSTTTQAPTDIGPWQVLEHALRHLAWLAKEDDTVRGALPARWHTALNGYVPEPFRELDGEEV